LRAIIYILLFFISFNGVAQKLADKEYYLVDSLVLEELSEGDKNLLENSLKEFHATKDDTSKIESLNQICENMMHQSWEDYQLFQHEMIVTHMTNKNLSEKEKFVYKKFLAHSLNNLSVISHIHGNVQASINFVNQGIAISLELNDSDAVATGYGNIGRIYKRQGLIDEAILYDYKALVINRDLNNFHGIGIGLNNLASIYQDHGSITRSLKLNQLSLKFREQINDHYGISMSKANIGYIYFLQGDLNGALLYFESSLETYRELGDNVGISSVLSNMGLLYHKKRDLNKALALYNESLEIRKKIDDVNGISTTLGNIGVIHHDNKEYDIALDYMSKSLKMREDQNAISGITDVLSQMGGTYYAKGDLKRAEECGLKSIKIAKKLGFPAKIKNAAIVLANVYKAQKRGMEALEMYGLFISMRDSVENKETLTTIAKIQANNEFEKAQIVKENEAKEEARVLEKETSRRDNIQYSLIFLSILVLFGIVLSLGFIKVSPTIAEGIIFFAFLILFEFVLVFTEPYLEQYTNGEPMYNLLANSVLALLIFPVHAILEKLLKKRIVK
jgi:tetratricopeptide (TPR) repeat protein